MICLTGRGTRIALMATRESIAVLGSQPPDGRSMLRKEVLRGVRFRSPTALDL